ncbi:YbcC family protein [Elioraea tepidiphila]|uniref:YbcC family protein n=1 Tax=Elioraea tepidiphila TaxID=457934 RepID=UPI0003603E95|nr:putative inorganic carbon transporter subunit DabA [Elioraea tepidiphila]
MDAVTFAPTLSAESEEETALALDRAVETACSRIAPLWPLDSFVAVNPFLGVADLPFPAAVPAMAVTAGARMLMPRRYWQGRIAAGAITREDIATALARLGMAAEPDGIIAAASAEAPPLPEPLPLVSDLLAEHAGLPPRLLADRIAHWCAAYCDAGQAGWRMPWRDRPLYAAWRAAAMHDRAPERAGLAGFRAALAALPAEPLAAIAAACDRLGVTGSATTNLMHRALADLAGWAGYLRQRDWTARLRGEPSAELKELLAVRLAAEAAALDCAPPPAARAWRTALRRYGEAVADADRSVDLVLLEAAEVAFQRRLARGLGHAGPARGRAEAQAVFCIDVRSEVFRRALEAVAPGVETLGFAGFFGFAIEVTPFGGGRARAQCPVLLAPAVRICETVAPGADESAARARLGLRQRLAAAWAAFRSGMVSAFPFVESLGVTYAARLLRAGFAPPAPPLTSAFAPTIAPGHGPAGRSGLATAARIDAAEAVLRAMSLTEGFAPLVLLVGHGAGTTNNPHAASLDCGACGGHTGEANAQVAAAVLNDPAVRVGLAGRGIAIPEDTVFLAGLHDTTTDDVVVFEERPLSVPHLEALQRLRAALAAAGSRARAERAGALGLAPGQGIDRAVRRRGRDWAEVRPEWGLAGNAAFIAAPRALTRQAVLDGRVFLHSYDHRADRDRSVLELILTAPVIVASWINLQYYGSSVDNAALGSGDKVLHNVTARVGVALGNGGDLRPGLPFQSVHDGRRLVHEPLRLSVFVAAPVEAIDGVLAKHDGLRALADHGWLHLFALDDAGGVAARYRGGLAWEARPFG